MKYLSSTFDAGNIRVNATRFQLKKLYSIPLTKLNIKKIFSENLPLKDFFHKENRKFSKIGTTNVRNEKSWRWFKLKAIKHYCTFETDIQSLQYC